MNALPSATLAAGLLLAFLAASGQAAAGEPQSSPPPAAEPVAAAKARSDDPNRKVCKYVVQTGSRMGRKICHTQAYWDEMELAARNKMREIDSQAIQQKSN